jgi:hypothetical protein
MNAVKELRKLSNDFGLTNTRIFFVDSWINYNERSNYLLNANIGVSAHFDHVETQFSFRTRILDYFWTGLPVITTKGDTLADLIEENKAGLTVAVKDVDGWANAISELFNNTQKYNESKQNSQNLASNYYWKEVLKPLYKFIQTATPAPDRLLMPDLLGENRFSNPYLASFPRLTKANLISAADLLKDKGLKAFVKKVAKKILRRN